MERPSKSAAAGKSLEKKEAINHSQATENTVFDLAVATVFTFLLVSGCQNKSKQIRAGLIRHSAEKDILSRTACLCLYEGAGGRGA